MGMAELIGDYRMLKLFVFSWATVVRTNFGRADSRSQHVNKANDTSALKERDSG